MGHEIVYCYRCGVRLGDVEFQAGAAFRIGYTTTCARCADALLLPLSPDERHAVLNPPSPDGGARRETPRGLPPSPLAHAAGFWPTNR